MDEFNPDDLQEFEVENTNFIEQGLKLIEFDENRFEIDQEALKIIRSIEDEIIVVSVIGKVKTGKSYLLNLILDNIGRKDAFKVGSSNDSCTKGIWIWGTAKEKLGKKAKILFIDSEATYPLNNKKSYDPQIFALIVLISSLLIFNTNSNIDENGISELSLTTQLSNSIATSSKVDKDAFITENSPKFLWVFRDFKLDKIDESTQKEISSKEYFDNCLRSKTGKTSSNSIIETFIKYFPDRDCCTLKKPVDNESDLKVLNNIFFDKLTPDFQKEITNLKNKIFKDLNSKRIKGKKFNGFSLAILIEEWVKAMNKGAVPNINSIFDILITKDIEDFYHRALNDYESKLETIKDVMEQEQIVKHLYDFKFESMMIYNKIFNFNLDIFSHSQYMAKYNEFKRKLEEEISNYETKIIDFNQKESNDKCQNLIINSFQIINEKINSFRYSANNCDEYLIDHKNFLNNYSENAKGPNKTKILIDFLSAKKPEFIKGYINKLENENKAKLQDILNLFNESEKKKTDAESRNKELNEKTQVNTEKINDLNSDLEKKRREIIELSEKINILDNDIKNKRENINAKVKKVPF